MTKKPDASVQYEQFKKIARDIGADEGRSAADDVMDRLARMPPDPKPVKKPKAKKPGG